MKEIALMMVGVIVKSLIDYLVKICVESSKKDQEDSTNAATYRPNPVAEVGSQQYYRTLCAFEYRNQTHSQVKYLYWKSEIKKLLMCAVLILLLAKFYYVYVNLLRN